MTLLTQADATGFDSVRKEPVYLLMGERCVQRSVGGTWPAIGSCRSRGLWLWKSRIQSFEMASVLLVFSGGAIASIEIRAP